MQPQPQLLYPGFIPQQLPYPGFIPQQPLYQGFIPQQQIQMHPLYQQLNFIDFVPSQSINFGFIPQLEHLQHQQFFMGYNQQYPLNLGFEPQQLIQLPIESQQQIKRPIVKRIQDTESNTKKVIEPIKRPYVFNKDARNISSLITTTKHHSYNPSNPLYTTITTPAAPVLQTQYPNRRSVYQETIHESPLEEQPLISNQTATCELGPLYIDTKIKRNYQTIKAGEDFLGPKLFEGMK